MSFVGYCFGAYVSFPDPMNGFAAIGAIDNFEENAPRGKSVKPLHHLSESYQMKMWNHHKLPTNPENFLRIARGIRVHLYSKIPKKLQFRGPILHLCIDEVEIWRGGVDLLPIL